MAYIHWPIIVKEDLTEHYFHLTTFLLKFQAAGLGQIHNINQALKDFSDYAGRKLYKVDKDTTQLLS